MKFQTLPSRVGSLGRAETASGCCCHRNTSPPAFQSRLRVHQSPSPAPSFAERWPLVREQHPAEYLEQSAVEIKSLVKISSGCKIFHLPKVGPGSQQRETEFAFSWLHDEIQWKCFHLYRNLDPNGMSCRAAHFERASLFTNKGILMPNACFLSRRYDFVAATEIVRKRCYVNAKTKQHAENIKPVSRQRLAQNEMRFCGKPTDSAEQR